MVAENIMSSGINRQGGDVKKPPSVKSPWFFQVLYCFPNDLHQNYNCCRIIIPKRKTGPFLYPFISSGDNGKSCPVLRILLKSAVIYMGIYKALPVRIPGSVFIFGRLFLQYRNQYKNYNCRAGKCSKV